ncbi:MAG: valine--tRNA ligase [Promethearchaeota archaeon]
MRLSDLESFFLEKRFDFLKYESKIRHFWKENKIYEFSRGRNGSKRKKPLFLIDTPPPYANGSLHHGHGMSYTHIDIIARYRRLRGYDTLLPLCYDDNGLPTEKFTEKKYGILPGQHPDNFTELCIKEAKESIEIQTQQLETLGFSYNHKISYRTIDDTCARITQQNFMDLYERGLIKRTYEPQLFCTSCRTAISQADIATREEDSELHYIKFPAITKERKKIALEIATSRPEFLPACSAIFFNPQDNRFSTLGKHITIFSPLNGKELLFLSDPRIDMEFGSGLMMACTFGDQEDIRFYREYQLPLIEILSCDGRLNENAEMFAGNTITEARKAILEYLNKKHYLIKSEPLHHTIATCERCSTPIEIIMSWQWALDTLSLKENLLDTSKKINWYPKHMSKRLENWINGLKWNWLISRQRHYGISIPTWYCEDCNHIILPERDELPIDPQSTLKDQCSQCGSTRIIPETDKFDTWMTSSLTPRILHQIYFTDGHRKFSPFDLRPQAHEIIRTWAFYTIYKEFTSGSGELPWIDILISGWGLGFQAKGKRKIKASKSSGGGLDPIVLCQQYGADTFRYWAAQARPGKDQHLDEKALNRGRKLITKIYNATKIILLLFEAGKSEINKIKQLQPDLASSFTTIEEQLKQITEEYFSYMDFYNYTDALKLLEGSFWKYFCSTFIETLKTAKNLNSLNKELTQKVLDFHKTYLLLFAPFFPYITEYCWATLWMNTNPETPYYSIHKIDFQD